jgi:hypothetical protein
MLAGACHCGAVRIEIPTQPDVATLCNCSVCRRYGGLWAYYDVGTVTVLGHPEHTDEYVWGDRTLRYVRCKHCGCVTHWEPLDPTLHRRMSVNIRNFDPSVFESVRIRRFDGADTWTYFD